MSPTIYSEPTSWFINQLSQSASKPKRWFYLESSLSSSDYSEKVLKWPTIRQTADELRAVTLNIPLSNADKGFNFFKETPSDLYVNAVLGLGFTHSNSGDEAMYTYAGRVKTANFSKGKCTLQLKDKLWDFTEKLVVGDVIFAGTWEEKTGEAGARAYHSAAEYNGKAYILHGITSGNNMLSSHVMYDITSDSWSTMNNSGPGYRYDHTAAEYNGKIYVHGGIRNIGGSLRNDTWEYNIAGDSWSEQACSSVLRMDHTSVINSHSMYVFGGYSSGYRNDCLRYDCTANAWSTRTSGSTARRSHAAAIYNGKMYIFGGYNASGYLNDLWEYNILADSWTQKTSGATARSDASMIECNSGYLYIFGGHNAGGYHNGLWEYNINDDSWLQKTSGATIRSNHVAIEYNNKMYIHGGAAGSSAYRKDVWECDLSPGGYETITFSAQNPADIAWSLCTSFGELSAIESTSNTDIDYIEWLAWKQLFTTNNIECEAFCDGPKVLNILNDLCDVTDSAVWIKENSKISFHRFTDISTLEMLLTADQCVQLDYTLGMLEIINKQYVFFNYATSDSEWDNDLYVQNYTSIETFGLHEDISKNESIWLTTSEAAIDFAQRKIDAFGMPPKTIDLKTSLVVLHKKLGESIRLTDNFYDITSANIWRIREKTVNMQTGDIKLKLEET